MRARRWPWMTRIAVACAPLAVGCASVPFDTEGTGGSLLWYTYKHEESVSVFTDLYVDANMSWDPTIPVVAGFPGSFAASVAPDGPAWEPRTLAVLAPPRTVRVSDERAFTRVDARVPMKGRARLDLGKVRMPIRVRTPARWVLVPALTGPSEMVGDLRLSAQAPAYGDRVRVLAGNRVEVGVAVRDARNRPLGWAGRCAFTASNPAFALVPHERCSVSVTAPETGTNDLGVRVTWKPHAFGADAPDLATLDLHTVTSPWSVTTVPSTDLASLTSVQLLRDTGGLFDMFMEPSPSATPGGEPVEPPRAEAALYHLQGAMVDGAPVALSEVAWTATGARVYAWTDALEAFMAEYAAAKERHAQLPDDAPRPDWSAAFRSHLARRAPDPRQAAGSNVVIVLLDTPGKPATLTYTAAGRTGTVTVK